MNRPESVPEFDNFKVSKWRSEHYRHRFASEIGDLESYGYEIVGTYNLFPWLELLNPFNRPTLSEELATWHREVKSNLASIVAFDLAYTAESDPLLHNRKSVILETREGKRSLLSVAFYDAVPSGWHFGGAGVYPIPEDCQSHLGHSLQHSERLAKAMRRKAYEIGVADHLAGSKTIITGEAWLESPILQVATGVLFSAQGIWPTVITGSDARQTPPTIKNMEIGSRIGRGIGQIVGTENGLPDTAQYVRYTMEHTYRALKRYFLEDGLPDLEGIHVAIQGLGKIGTATAKMFIDTGASEIYVTDIALFPETAGAVHIDPGWRRIVQGNLSDVKRKVNTRKQKLELVHPEEIWDQTPDVFCPCSSTEHIIDRARVDQLAATGHLRVILSGANNPLTDPEVASYAYEQYRILTPPPELSNGGSATAAAFEPDYIRHRENYSGPADYIEKILIPHIQKNAYEKISILADILQRPGVNSLCEAGEIAFQEWRTQTTRG